MKRTGKSLLGVFLALLCLLTMLPGCTLRKPEVLKAEGDGVTVELQDIAYENETLTAVLRLTFTPEIAEEIAKSEEYREYLQTRYMPQLIYDDNQTNLNLYNAELHKTGDVVQYAELGFGEPLRQSDVKRNMEIEVNVHTAPSLQFYLPEQ